MGGFEEREQAFENKFGHDEETEFKILARMAHLFGLWAAEQLGLKGTEAQAYADRCVDAELVPDGRGVLIAKCEKDFAAKGISHTRHRMEREMEKMYADAHKSITGI
jgi:hypothetical protein